jgi:hypothetical protein
LFLLGGRSGRDLQSDGGGQLIESGCDGSVELGELSEPFFRNKSVSGTDGGVRRQEVLDFVEQFEEDQADPVTLRLELIAA